MSDDELPANPALADFEMLHLIGEGSAGVVFKARHVASGQAVAVKILPPHLVGNAVFRKRFEHEFHAARKIDHPNIVRALAYGESGDPFLVMEYVEGESLGARLERDGRLPETEAIRLIAQVCAGLDEAHSKGLVHRDVKPDNILVMKDGRVKLADLGLVKGMDSAQDLTKPGSGLGTPHFMAPEQFRDAKHATVRCDVYSVAATLYQMVVGRLPFESTGPLDTWMKKCRNELVPPRDLVPGLTRRTDEVIRRAMSPDPEQRPASCGKLADELTAATASAPNADEVAPPVSSEKTTSAVPNVLLERLQMVFWLIISVSAILIAGRLLLR